MNVDIRKALQDCGVGIEELARRLGVNRQTVYYYIKQGDKNPVAQLEKIAAALGVQVVDLFEQQPPETTPRGTCPHCGKPIKIKLEE